MPRVCNSDISVVPGGAVVFDWLLLTRIFIPCWFNRTGLLSSLDNVDVKKSTSAGAEVAETQSEMAQTIRPNVSEPKPPPTKKDETDVPSAIIEEKKEKNPRWVTRAMAEEFTREEVLVTTLKEAILYVFFVVAVSMSMYCIACQIKALETTVETKVANKDLNQTLTSSRSLSRELKLTVGRRSTAMFYITESLTNQFVLKTIESDESFTTKFKGVTTASDFWDYTTSLMLDSFYWEEYYDTTNSLSEAPIDDRKILYENLLLGVPRMRQVRVRNDSCPVHESLTSLFKKCLSTYRESIEDTEPFIGDLSNKTYTYTSAKETLQTYSSGYISTYGGGGYYQDLARNRNESFAILESLQNDLWISRATRALIIDFAVYNGNYNLFCVCKLIFEFPPMGGIITNHCFKAIHIVKFRDFFDYYTFVFEMIVYGLVLFYLCEELREIWFFKFRYFLQFWTYIDWSIIILAFGYMLTNYILLPNVPKALEKIIKHPDEYGNLEEINDIKKVNNDFAACIFFCAVIKLFKYLNFNKTMGQLNNTMRRCALDICGFCIMFFIIFCAFAQLGYLIFGNEVVILLGYRNVGRKIMDSLENSDDYIFAIYKSKVTDFRNFGDALFTLLRTILGDFDYESIRIANSTLAPPYFLGFIFFVFFILINMFLAIINDTYADVKTEIAVAPEEMQMTGFLKDGFLHLLKKCGCLRKEYIPPKVFNKTIFQIRDSLKKCGFNDLEIEMFFARYNITTLPDVPFDRDRILKELEIQVAAIGKDDSPTIQLSDFILQQGRMDQIEGTIDRISFRIEALMQKCDNLTNTLQGRR